MRCEKSVNLLFYESHLCVKLSNGVTNIGDDFGNVSKLIVHLLIFAT